MIRIEVAIDFEDGVPVEACRRLVRRALALLEGTDEVAGYRERVAGETTTSILQRPWDEEVVLVEPRVPEVLRPPVRPDPVTFDRGAYDRSPCPPGCFDRDHLLTGHPRVIRADDGRTDPDEDLR